MQPASLANSPEDSKAPVAAFADTVPMPTNGVHRERCSSSARRERSEPRSASLSPRRSRDSATQSHVTHATHSLRDTHASRDSANASADCAHPGEDGEEAWEMQNAQDLDPQAFLRNLAEQPAEVTMAEADESAGGVDGNDEDEYQRTMQQARRRRNGTPCLLFCCVQRVLRQIYQLLAYLATAQDSRPQCSTDRIDSCAGA